MDLGSELRRARQARGLTLAELSDRTKISQKALRAIEQNAFARLPGGLFSRGFLRAYALEVGLAPDAVVRQYAEVYEPTDFAAEGDGAGDLARVAAGADDLEQHQWRRQLVVTAVIVLVSAVAYFLLASNATHRRPAADTEAPAPPATQSALPATDDGPPVGTRGSGPAPPTATPAPALLRLEWQPERPCWVSVKADGRSAIQRLMKPGDRTSVDVENSAVVRVGDAEACALSVNGSPAHAMGPSGQPLTVRITRENYQQFIR